MRFDAVVFDIDNVLIDTRASYIDCIRATVASYLETTFGFHISRAPLLSRKDVEAFKSLGGFNDDWDTSYGLVLYFLSLKPKRRTLNELSKQKNLLRLATMIKSKPFGVRGAERTFGIQNGVTLKKIADVFQRLFLGDFVWNEQLLISKSFLEQLKRKGFKLGIVTGRNREETRFTLRRFRIDRFFDAIVTKDETPDTKRKPHPYGLLQIANALGNRLRYVYVGDLPDDMLAARKAKKRINIAACGFLAATEDPKRLGRELKKAGAACVCTGQRELKDLIFGK